MKSFSAIAHNVHVIYDQRLKRWLTTLEHITRTRVQIPTHTACVSQKSMTPVLRSFMLCSDLCEHPRTHVCTYADVKVTKVRMWPVCHWTPQYLLCPSRSSRNLLERGNRIESAVWYQSLKLAHCLVWCVSWCFFSPVCRTHNKYLMNEVRGSRYLT